LNSEKRSLPAADAFSPGFLLDQGQRFRQNRFPKEISKWLDMNSGEADSAGAGLPAHRGRIHGRPKQKGQRKEKLNYEKSD
jgi:hypothetical protein